MESTRPDTDAADPAPGANDDLSALAWVQDELRRSLDTAHKALRRFLRDAQVLDGSDVDTVDPAVLRAARIQLHQGAGALELVGLPAQALVLRASEAAVQRCIAKPALLTPAIVEHIERASFALLDYLARLLAGKHVAPLQLFPQYRAVQEAAGAERVHPADLWPHDWRWRELPAESGVRARPADASSRIELEGLLLQLMRGAQPQHSAAQMSEICAGLGAGATQPEHATLWKIAAAVFEAQAHGLLGFDVFSKRVASRLLAQFRAIERGQTEVSERLAQDLLFFCAQSASPGDGRGAPRLSEVRQVYGLAHEQPVDYAASVLGRYDPTWLAQARKRVSAAKESWSAVAGGDPGRMAGLAEQFALVGDSLKRLFPQGDAFAAELQNTLAQLSQSGVAPTPSLAMEVATCLLYVEASLEDADFDHPQQAQRVNRLVERLHAARHGRPSEPLEAWAEDLYRRVSDRQTMGSVVQELRASLSESERLIDQFFRSPADHDVLIPVPVQLATMRGVLSVLGMDHAAAALLRMRDEVEELVTTAVDPQRVLQSGLFDRLAGNLGALGFLIDMLAVQPQMAKSLFAYDPVSGAFAPVMGRGEATEVIAPAAPSVQPVEPRLIEQAQMLAFAAVRDDVPLREVERDMEHLAREAYAAEQPGLAATVLHAQEAFGHAAEDAAALRDARGVLSEALVDFVHTASEPAGLDLLPAAQPSDPFAAAPTPPAALAPAGGLEDDPEMREVFLEEAREVLQDAQTALASLVHAPSDLTLLTTLRRAFHTLKGSSRMVGLNAFGEAAWTCEQFYNTQLADQRGATPAGLAFTRWALDHLAPWVEAIATGNAPAQDAASFQRALARIGDTDAVPAAVSAPAPLASAPAPLASVPAALDSAPAPFEPLPAFATARHAVPAEPEVEFELDLSGLDSRFEDAPMPPAAWADDPPVPSQQPLDPAAGFDAERTQLLPRWDEVGEATEIVEPAPAMLDRLDLEFDAAAPAPAEVPATGVGALPQAATDDAGDRAVDEPTAPVEAPAVAERVEDDNVKRVGPLRIGIPLFNIFLNEADELSRRLGIETAEWALETHRPVSESAIALAHSLAGSSATVGFTDLSLLSRAREPARSPSHPYARGTDHQARLFVDVADEVRRLLHQFAAGFLKDAPPSLFARLAAHEAECAVREAQAAQSSENGLRLDPGSTAGGLFGPEAEPVDERDASAFAGDGPVTDTGRGALPLTPHAEEPQALVESQFGEFGLDTLKPLAALPSAPRREVTDASVDPELDAVDAVDAELFPIFEEEALELLPLLAADLRAWGRQPEQTAHADACMRTLHTLKGGARLAGAMRLGERAHRLETGIEHALAHPPVDAEAIEWLQAECDALHQDLERLRHGEAAPVADIAEPVGETPAAAQWQSQSQSQSQEQSQPELDSSPPEASEFAEVTTAAREDAVPAVEDMPAAHATDQPDASQPFAAPSFDTLAPIDWSRFTGRAPVDAAVEHRAPAAVQQASVRVRAPLLDRLVNQAGEVSITRSRIESGIGQMKGSLTDLTENLDRLRGQLRDIELQAETQMTSRLEAQKVASQAFDPLEFDRFTRFQELTRMMAESVNDVATVQRTLQRSLQVTEDELVAQGRMTRELQDDLLRTRMVEFEGLSDRLYRVVRQAAKETGKQVRLDIVGGGVEIDRGVLERMTGAFEHLLRNCVTHGIESPEVRSAIGKAPAGTITVSLAHEGNEVTVEIRDDGAGLDLQRIRAKGVAMGLLGADADPSAAELAALIFTPGFSTASSITELAGRGVGMDVVRAEVNAIGGRVETASEHGQGTAFKLVLPLTTAVTQVVRVRCGDVDVAIPSTLVETVRRAGVDEIDQAYASGSYVLDDRQLPFFWLGALLQRSLPPESSTARNRPVVVIRSAQQRIALHVDEVLGNQEVVVKNLGPQLSRMPGLVGVTLLTNGAVALIYNPVALATLYGDAARAATRAARAAPQAPSAEANQSAAAPLVLVVDDSLTVRRVTQRLLAREGYRVALAKDGLDALERLAEERPAVVLSDIEMPRMDGFDLLRNIRAEQRWNGLPVIMITSRIAQKHRDHATELGADHYLGKPYAEEELLGLVAQYAAAAATPH
jgi:chemosensory pili system protein ChpA (sensor histidine kinase/response regulator)